MGSVFMSWTHFVLILGVVSALTLEMALCRGPLTPESVKRLSRIDLIYGLFALTLLAAGFSRALFYAKGWDFYQSSPWFWVKLATFAMIGGLSLFPTLRFVAWRRRLDRNEPLQVDDAELRRVRRFVHWQLGLLTVVVLAAAMMARGF